MASGSTQTSFVDGDGSGPACGNPVAIRKSFDDGAILTTDSRIRKPMLVPSPPRRRQLSVTESAARSRPMQGSAMPQAYFSSGPSLTSIKRPRCSHCTMRMMLASISPGPVGFEHRRFECPKCNSLKNEVVGDPMKSAPAGWLAGELRTPN